MKRKSEQQQAKDRATIIQRAQINAQVGLLRYDLTQKLIPELHERIDEIFDNGDSLEVEYKPAEFSVRPRLVKKKEIDG